MFSEGKITFKNDIDDLLKMTINLTKAIEITEPFLLLNLRQNFEVSNEMILNRLELTEDGGPLLQFIFENKVSLS